MFFNQGLVQEVTGKMSDVQQLTQVGRELVDLSETGQLENLEDRLTRINNAWEDLSSAAEQRMLTLPKYKAKLADFEKSVDQMNQWLEDMERETNKVHPKEEEADLAKNKIDVSVYWDFRLNPWSFLSDNIAFKPTTSICGREDRRQKYRTLSARVIGLIYLQILKMHDGKSEIVSS